MARVRTGDIFSIEVAPSTFVFGRIVLDVRGQCIRPGLIEPSSPLAFFADSILIDVYRLLADSPSFQDAGTTELLIHGLFTDREALRDDEWQIVDRSVIDPTTVEFPESLVSHSSGIHFVRGEIMQPISVSRTQFERINVRPSVPSSFSIGDSALYYLGRKDLISHEYADRMGLESTDLRFSEHRAEVYRRLKLDPDEPYHQVAARLGHDLERFYRKRGRR